MKERKMQGVLWNDQTLTILKLSFDGSTPKEISELLKIPLTNIQAQLSRNRLKYFIFIHGSDIVEEILEKAKHTNLYRLASEYKTHETVIEAIIYKKKNVDHAIRLVKSFKHVEEKPVFTWKCPRCHVKSRHIEFKDVKCPECGYVNNDR